MLWKTSILQSGSFITYSFNSHVRNLKQLSYSKTHAVHTSKPTTEVCAISYTEPFL